MHLNEMLEANYLFFSLVTAKLRKQHRVAVENVKKAENWIKTCSKKWRKKSISPQFLLC